MIRVLVRGGGDLVSGAILRMARAGICVLVTELAEPLAVRRTVSFAQAIFDGKITIEDVSAKRISSEQELADCYAHSMVAVIVDPDLASLGWYHADILVDGRMMKRKQSDLLPSDPFLIGLGPGFTVGDNCHAIVETKRGPTLGRVIWNGSAEKDTGEPESVGGFTNIRVLRSRTAGPFIAVKSIGEWIEQGSPIAFVDGRPILAPFTGLLRGLISSGIWVERGMKVGDLDPRNEPGLCHLVSDKALAVGGGVLEAILSQPNFRRALGDP